MQNINTYLDLKNSVAAWLNRKDQATLDNIPNFINFAEKQFTRLVKLPYYEVTVNFQIDPQYPFIVLPQDFLSAKHIMVNNEPYNRTDVETFYRLQGTRQFSGTVITTDDVVGMDNFKAFTRIGEQIHFYPTPQAGDIVTMIYSQDIPEMQFDADQPYSLLIAPDILLYLCLRHASIWLRDPEMEQYWMAKAQEAAQALQQQLDEANWSGSALVVPAFSA